MKHTQAPPHKALAKAALLLRCAPWLAVVCALLLSAFVLRSGLRTAQQDAELALQLTREKGNALIGTLEGALRTGMGFHWTDDELQDLLEKTAAQPDLYHVAITDAKGTVLVSSDGNLIGQVYASSEELGHLLPDARAQAHILRRPGQPDSYQVYRMLEVAQFDQRLESYGQRHGHGRGQGWRRQQVMEAERKYTGQPLYVFAAYAMNAIDEARAAADRRFTVMTTVAVFLALVGAAVFFLVQGYRQSRRLMYEARAFSAHIVRTLPVGVITTDTSKRIITANPEAQRILGSMEDALRGRHLRQFLPCLPEKDVPAMRETEVRCDIGGKKGQPLALCASPIIDSEGEFIGSAHILRDLGELRHLQAELRHSERLAALGNMAAGIAHEVRNPLGAIKGLARFFEEASAPGSEEERVAGIMRHEVARLDRVVSDMLDFARPDHLRLEPVALDALAERIRRLLQTDLEALPAELHITLPHPVPTLLLDADRMTQALLNLCCNSVQALAPGGHIEFAYAEEDDMALLQIRDNGRGMSPEDIKHAFSPYFTTRADGTGLGLSIVHKIVEAHQGSVTLTSTEGQGTCVTVRLPVGG